MTYFRFPPSPLLRFLFSVAVGALVIAAFIVAAALLAPRLGLGLAEDFIFYRWFQVSRSDAAMQGAAWFALALALAGSTSFDWRQKDQLKHLLVNIAVACTAATLGLVVLEAGFRLVKGIPFWPIENRIAKERGLLRTQTANEYHPDLGWVLKPGIAANQHDPETSFTTGDHGVRMNSNKREPLPRGGILAVGDSFTAGSEVGDPHAWPAQLERLLGEPVVNGGVGGWAADQIVLRAEELAPIVKPHTVVISFLADDILRSGFRVYGSANKPWFEVDSSGNLVRHNKPVPLFSGKPSETAFSLYGYFHVVVFAMDRLGLGPWLRRSDENVKNGNDPVSVSCKLLERARDKLSAMNIRLIFLLQHGGDARHDRTSQKPHADKVIACARAAGIETIDTFGPLLEVYRKGFPAYKELFVMHDNDTLYGHMSEKGNAFIATLVAEAMRD